MCPLTVHALLHIAPGIRENGPVWAYWAFPGERHCGEMGRSIKSRRHPYVNLSNYVTAAAHLNQIAILYNLDHELSLRPPPAIDQSLTVAACSYISPFYPFQYSTLADPLFALTPPRGLSPLSPALWRKVTATLATRYNTTSTIIRSHLPQEQPVAQYGRITRRDGGDTIHGADLGSSRPDGRDATFIRVGQSLIYIIK